MIRLKDNKSAQASLDFALRLNPWNHRSLESKGWLALEAEEWGTAKRYFLDSLRQNPNIPTAKQGLLNAIKAKYPFYSYYIKWEIWVRRNQKKLQYAFVGLFILLIPMYFLLDKYEETAYGLYVQIPAFILLFPLLIFGLLSSSRAFYDIALLKDEEAKPFLGKKEKDSAKGCLILLGIIIFAFVLIFYGFWLENESL